MGKFICPTCNKAISDTAKSCPKCGRNFSEEERQSLKKSQNKFGLVLFAAFVILGLIWMFSGKDGLPDDISNISGQELAEGVLTSNSDLKSTRITRMVDGPCEGRDKLTLFNEQKSYVTEAAIVRKAASVLAETVKDLQKAKGHDRVCQINLTVSAPLVDAAGKEEISQLFWLEIPADPLMQADLDNTPDARLLNVAQLGNTHPVGFKALVNYCLKDGIDCMSFCEQFM